MIIHDKILYITFDLMLLRKKNVHAEKIAFRDTLNTKNWEKERS